jgi:CysZ protein
MKSFYSALFLYPQALRFVLQKRKVVWFVFPILFSMLLFSFGFVLVSQLTESVFIDLVKWLDMENWDFIDSGLLNSILWFSLWLIFKLLFFILFAYIGGFLVLIFMSPVLAYISEKTEEELSGVKSPFSFSFVGKSVARGFYFGLRNMFLQLMYVFVFFLLSFIPMLALFTPFAILLVSAYFYGFSFLDYTIERRNISIKQSVKLMYYNKYTAIGIGLPFALSLLIPWLGGFIAGFISILSVISATLCFTTAQNKFPDLQTIKE